MEVLQAPTNALLLLLLLIICLCITPREILLYNYGHSRPRCYILGILVASCESFVFRQACISRLPAQTPPAPSYNSLALRAFLIAIKWGILAGHGKLPKIAFCS